MTVLLSPVFGFTADELARLRGGKARRRAARLPVRRACRDVPANAGRAAGACRERPVRTLLDGIETRLLLRAVYPDSDCAAHFDRLLGYADACAANGRHGLPAYLRFGARKAEGRRGQGVASGRRGAPDDDPTSRRDWNTRGLLADLCKEFNTTDAKKMILTDPFPGTRRQCLRPQGADLLSDGGARGGRRPDAARGHVRGASRALRRHDAAGLAAGHDLLQRETDREAQEPDRRAGRHARRGADGARREHGGLGADGGAAAQRGRGAVRGRGISVLRADGVGASVDDHMERRGGLSARPASSGGRDGAAGGGAARAASSEAYGGRDDAEQADGDPAQGASD